MLAANGGIGWLPRVGHWVRGCGLSDSNRRIGPRRMPREDAHPQSPASIALHPHPNAYCQIQ